MSRLLITGAAGFLGRRLIHRLQGRWRIIAVDRNPPPPALGRRPDLEWHVLDIRDADALGRLSGRIALQGGADVVFHFAAHFDFTGEDHPEYLETNVEGTRLLLDACAGLGVERFVFTSSLAACSFPPPGRPLDESSPADGDHPYARSKAAGEALVRAESRFPTTIVRFAALYSDWCEYAPLYAFLESWLSKRWDSRLLGGSGRSAVPYLHVRDATLLLERMLELRRDLEPAEVLIASPATVASHAELFREATAYAFRRPRRAIRVPRPVAAVGIQVRDLVGRLSGRRPFERPWMARLIDLQLTADPSHTQIRLGWAPRSRLEVVSRLPFLIENRRSEPETWVARNESRIRTLKQPTSVVILRLLEEHEDEIYAKMTELLRGDSVRFPHYVRIDSRDHDWRHRQLLRNLAHSVRTRHLGVFRKYCHELAQRRREQGIGKDELRNAIVTFGDVVREVLTRDGRDASLERDLQDLLRRLLEFGIDGIEDAYEEVGALVATVPG